MRNYNNHAIQGFLMEKLVQKKLQQYGYEVERIGKSVNFDLLVNRKYQVEVKYSSIRKIHPIRGIYWGFSGIRVLKPVDFFAFVFAYPNGKIKIKYTTFESIRTYCQKVCYPHVFAKNGYGINMGINQTNLYKLCLTSNPLKLIPSDK